MFPFLRRSRSRLKSVALVCLVVLVTLSLLTQHLRPSLIIRDMGYLTRPIWDKPGPQPEILIPRFFHSNAMSSESLCSFHGWQKRKNDSKIKVIDAVIFSIELDILEIRLLELWDVVDTFLVMEADRTFTGAIKPLFLQENMGRFEWAKTKLIRISLTGILEEHPLKEFENEVKMRKKMTEKIKSLQPANGDLIIVGDVDEIPFKSTIQLLKSCTIPSVLHLQMRNYIYSFEFYIDTSNWKPHVSIFDSKFFYFHGKSKNSNYTLADSGWHCSFCFRKIENFRFKMLSYSHADRTTGAHLLDGDNIQKKICDGSNIFDMFPEAYSFRELFTFLGNVPSTHTYFGIPDAVLLNYEKFRFLLPGGCIREDASEKYLHKT